MHRGMRHCLLREANESTETQSQGQDGEVGFTLGKRVGLDVGENVQPIFFLVGFAWEIGVAAGHRAPLDIVEGLHHRPQSGGEAKTCPGEPQALKELKG
jgi:hypothetical protein